MTAIIKKELKTYFYQPTGYIFLSLMTLITALFFVSLNVSNPNFHHVLGSMAILFFVVIPTLTMRLFADEIRNRTDQLLFTSPLSIWQIVIGKYLAASALFIIAMVITMVFPFIMSRFGELPTGQIIGAYFGFILIGLGFISMGLFVSVMTENQIIAAAATAGAIFLVFILDGIAAGMPADARSSLIFVAVIIVSIGIMLYYNTKNFFAGLILSLIGLGAAGIIFYIDRDNRLIFDSLITRTLRWFSVFSRFDNKTRGIVNLADIVFYITFAMVFIYLTINVIEKRRWR